MLWITKINNDTIRAAKRDTVTELLIPCQCSNFCSGPLNPILVIGNFFSCRTPYFIALSQLDVLDVHVYKRFWDQWPSASRYWKWATGTILPQRRPSCVYVFLNREWIYTVSTKCSPPPFSRRVFGVLHNIVNILPTPCFQSALPVAQRGDSQPFV